jgi:trk system potassium uptake protein TrkA
MTIHGSATDIRTLEKAGTKNSDVVLCLVRHDSDNIAISILAKSLGVKSIIALLRKPEYEPAYKSAGVTTLISLTDLLLHQLMMEIEQPNVKSIMPLGGGKAEIYAVEIPPGATGCEKHRHDCQRDHRTERFPSRMCVCGHLS